MDKICLFAAVSAIALCAQGSIAAERSSTPVFGKFDVYKAPKGAKLLYTQNSNGIGSGVNSQNGTSGATGDIAADDFVVPKKTQWTVTEVDVTGMFYDGSGGGTQNVIFYEDDHGKPGKAVKKGSFKKLSGTNTGSGFEMQLPGHGLKLKPGAYWVSFAVNCSFESGCGQWNWEMTSVVHGNQAEWESPGSTGACSTWQSLYDCFGYTGDLMFDLRGTSKRK
jgi:hypothetical protein